MKSTIAILVSALTVLQHAGFVLAQTPAGFRPAVKSSLNVAFVGDSFTAGDDVPLEQTALSPAISFPRSAGNSSHVVLMVDLDAPAGAANNTFSPLLHWLVPVPAGQVGLATNDTEFAPVAPYFGPQPSPGTGKHRYAIILLKNPDPTFEMPAAIEFDPSEITDRFVFPLEKLIAKTGLKPVAATWFATENITVVATSAAGRMVGSTSAFSALGVVALAVAASALL